MNFLKISVLSTNGQTGVFNLSISTHDMTVIVNEVEQFELHLQ